MRKLIMIATLVLVSATAQAGARRGLTLASNDEPVATTPLPAAAETSKAAETPAYVARPAPVNPTTPALQPDQAKDRARDQAKLAPEPSAATAKVDKPKRRHESTEARVVYELHRHGIYW